MVKSKSMLTEECGLNPFLEQHGIEVTDTDLGEWIVQLRDEHPSHIVLPAIHIKKEEVGELLPPRARHRARRPTRRTSPKPPGTASREKFLAAEAGLTGVNFGIAETGGFVVCTNEGNSDLGTSLPPHAHRLDGDREARPAARTTWASSCGCSPAPPRASRSPPTARTTTARGRGCELHIVLAIRN